jgi:hypothetical protein
LYRVIEKRSQEKNERDVACGVVPKSHADQSSRRKFNRDEEKVSGERVICERPRPAGSLQIASSFIRATDSVLARQSAEVHRFRSRRIYNEVAKPSREHDQWRLSMMLSSFPGVVRQWENSREA